VLTNLTAFTNPDGYAFAGCWALQDVRLGGPITSINTIHHFDGCVSVTNLVMDCPRLGEISSGCYFYNCTNLASITLNTPVLTNIASDAFCSAKPNRLGTVVFGMTNVFTAGSFKNCSALTNLVFYGPMPSTATLDNILNAVTAGTTNHACVIYASRHQADWQRYWKANPVSDEEQAANLMPPNCRGVYVTAGGARKAWIVEQDSPYDVLKYFYIRVCDNNLGVLYDWIEDHCGINEVEKDVMAVSNALVSIGVNGLFRWQSYVLGLDPNNSASVVLCDARQDAAADKVTFYARNVVPNTNDHRSVNYVLSGSNDGVNWSPIGLPSTTNALSVTLPAAFTLFRIRTDIILK